MLRKDRAVTSFEEIYEILERCDTLRVAFTGEEYPYLVPVSFGVRRSGTQVTLYFHGAKRGMKAQRIASSPNVCFEADLFHKVEKTAMGITTRYESVIGRGIIAPAEGEEVLEGLRAICEHYGYADFPVENCRNLPMTAVYKISVSELTGKRNLPESKS